MSEADKKAIWNTAVTRIEPNRVASARIRHCRAHGTRLLWRSGLSDFDGRTALAGNRAFDGRDFGRVDRSRRDAAKRVGRADRRINRSNVERGGCRRDHVDQSSPRRGN